jgi:hypothetical protein
MAKIGLGDTSIAANHTPTLQTSVVAFVTHVNDRMWIDKRVAHTAQAVAWLGLGEGVINWKNGCISGNR